MVQPSSRIHDSAGESACWMTREKQKAVLMADRRLIVNFRCNLSVSNSRLKRTRAKAVSCVTHFDYGTAQLKIPPYF
jgi:hypothetical protein